MRIIGGTAKGRNLQFPSGSKERPTSDFLREALFNLLGSLQDKLFVDLFAGSGSVGLEAASRGASQVYFVETNRNLVSFIKKNIRMCRLDDQCIVKAQDIKQGLRDLFNQKYEADVIFADPPYNRDLVGVALNLLDKYKILSREGLIVIQHSIKEPLATPPESYFIADQRKYGENALTFLRWRENNAG
jgi:16S rRNA (guanine(966)-N(2))-methyltransferase RsmD